MIVKGIIDDVFPNIWPLIVFISVVAIILRGTYLFSGNKKVIIYKEILALVFILYVLSLYYVLTYQNTGYGGVNFVPFNEMFRYTFGSQMFMKNIVGNILLFVPFGFFTAYYVDTKKIVPPILITLAVSLCAEGIQYHIGRVFDVDDVILNVLGGFLGCLLFIGLSAIRSHLPKFMKSDGFMNFLIITIIIILVLFALGINIFSYL